MSEARPARSDHDRRRAERFAIIFARITAENRPLTPTMTEPHFRAMVERMTEHQLIYEEYAQQAS